MGSDPGVKFSGNSMVSFGRQGSIASLFGKHGNLRTRPLRPAVRSFVFIQPGSRSECLI